jgi:hypothetical protein
LKRYAIFHRRLSSVLSREYRERIFSEQDRQELSI